MSINDLRTIVSKNLQRLLDGRNESVQSLVDRSGVSRTTIYRALDGERELTLSNAIAICKAFAVDLSELISEGKSNARAVKKVGGESADRRRRGSRRSADRGK